MYLSLIIVLAIAYFTINQFVMKNANENWHPISWLLIFTFTALCLRIGDYQWSFVIVMNSLLFILTALDAKKQWLPREFTLALILTGLFVHLVNQQGMWYLSQVLVVGSLFLMFVKTSNFELGDALLIIGLYAWQPLIMTSFALFIGFIAHIIALKVTQKKAMCVAPFIVIPFLVISIYWPFVATWWYWHVIVLLH